MRHPRAKGLIKALLSGLLLAGAAFVVALIDPFGLESDSEKFSADIAQYIASPFYARGLGAREPVGQKQISVVYLDEAGLDQMRGIWKGYPPSYLNDAQLIEDVVAGAGSDDKGQALPGPTAVFVDFMFLSKGRRPDEFESFAQTLGEITHASAWSAKAACRNDELVKLACIQAAHGTPVIIAGDKKVKILDDTDATPDILSVAAMASIDVADRSYPLLSRKDGADSPAAMMFVARCLDDPTGCRPKEDFVRLRAEAQAFVRTGDTAHGRGDADAAHGRLAADAADRIRKALDGRFAVSWSSRQEDGEVGANALYGAIFGDTPNCQGGEVEHPALYTWGDMARRVGDRLTPWRVTRLPDPLDPPEKSTEVERPCNYALSLPYGFYTKTSLSSPFRQRLFSNKLVLIGSQMNNSNDWLRSPVQGSSPGVQYHAMALDNLLEARGRDKALPRFDDWTETLARLVAAGLIFILVFLGGVHRIERNDLRARVDAKALHGRAKVWAAWRFVALYARFLVVDGLVILVAVMVAVRLNFPINWVAISTVVLGHGLWSVREVIGEDVKPITETWMLTRALRWLSERLSIEHEVLHENVGAAPMAEVAPDPHVKPDVKPQETVP